MNGKTDASKVSKMRSSKLKGSSEVTKMAKICGNNLYDASAKHETQESEATENASAKHKA